MAVHPVKFENLGWPLKQKTLRDFDADLLQGLALLDFFDAFCHHGQAQLVREIDDAFNELTGVACGAGGHRDSKRCAPARRDAFSPLGDAGIRFPLWALPCLGLSGARQAETIILR